MNNKNEWDMLKAWIHSFSDKEIIEEINEINRHIDGISDFVNEKSQIVHGDIEFVQRCIFDVYDERKKRLDFKILIFCNWVSNLKK